MAPGDGTVYRERLWAPWWAWAVAGIGPLMFGVAFGYALSTLVGWLVAGALIALIVVSLIGTAPMIEVSDRGIRAGRAFLETQYIGTATALDAAQAHRMRGVDADGRAYCILRGWLPGAVQLVVDDDRDPTPYWYLSTAQPRALAAALNAVSGGDAGETGIAPSADVEGFSDGATRGT